MGVARRVLRQTLKMKALCAFETYATVHYIQGVITLNITVLILITVEIARRFVSSVV